MVRYEVMLTSSVKAFLPDREEEVDLCQLGQAIAHKKVGGSPAHQWNYLTKFLLSKVTVHSIENRKEEHLQIHPSVRQAMTGSGRQKDNGGGKLLPFPPALKDKLRGFHQYLELRRKG